MSSSPASTVKPWEKPYAERFSGRKPRVCLGFVAFGDIYSEVFESTVAWAFQAGARLKDKFEIFTAIASRKEQYRARNHLIEEARQHGCDFMLMLDDDHTLSDCPNIIDDFFAEEKPLQGGLYIQRRDDKEQPVIVHYNEPTGECYWYDMSEVPMDGGPVDVLGGGCNWIDMTLFDFMRQPHWWPYPYDRREIVFLPDEKYGLDLQLSIRAKELGVQPWLNGKVKIGHVSHERKILYPPGKKHAARCPECDGLAASHGDFWVCTVCKTRLEQK